MTTKHAYRVDGQLCLQSHYSSIVEAQKHVEVYQIGDIDCPSCLRLMAEKHSALAEVFRGRLAVATARSEAVESPWALCHECSELVEVVAGKLTPHHGVSGDGCPLNDTDAQIYLHQRVVDRIVELETTLAFGGSR